MLEKLKNLNVDRIDIEEAVALATWGRAAANGYQHYELDPPKWLADGIKQLDDEIRRRRTDILHARLAEITARKNALKTREERKSDLDSEEAKVRAALGLPA